MVPAENMCTWVREGGGQQPCSNQKGLVISRLQVSDYPVSLNAL